MGKSNPINSSMTTKPALVSKHTNPTPNNTFTILPYTVWDPVKHVTVSTDIKISEDEKKSIVMSPYVKSKNVERIICKWLLICFGTADEVIKYMPSTISGDTLYIPKRSGVSKNMFIRYVKDALDEDEKSWFANEFIATIFKNCSE